MFLNNILNVLEMFIKIAGYPVIVQSHISKYIIESTAICSIYFVYLFSVVDFINE